MDWYDKLFRPLLFRFFRDPETAHNIALTLLDLASRSPQALAALARAFAIADERLEQTVFGIRFANPVGLAGGFSKTGKGLPALAALGFGFVEMGTITPLPQQGFARPRIHRLPDREALINRMGFPNDGAEAARDRLALMRSVDVPIIVNIGKGADTPIDRAGDDYRAVIRATIDSARLYAVHVSSPNTAGLRALHGRGFLSDLIGDVHGEIRALRPNGTESIPILLKVAPDLTNEETDDVLQVCEDHGVDGIIATNTTVSRAAIIGHPKQNCEGGLSGKPLFPMALQKVAYIHRHTEGRIPIIGVGGISTPDDVLRMFDAGATLVELLTALMYHGPSLPGDLNADLLGHMLEHDLKTLGDFRALRLKK
jgi:dihydroorotate dehydrogenase